VRDRTRQVLGRGCVCNECERGATNADDGCNECGQGVQRMRIGGCNECDGVQRMRLCNECEWGATNAERGCNKCEMGATNVDSNGCFTRCNECDTTNATTGATDARSGVRELCLGARRAGDSNTKWRRQGVLGGAHNLLENGRGSTKRAKRVY
jgi:hypothetical protein